MTLNEIKTAVDAGHSVKWKSQAYDVIKDSLGEYLIVCSINGHAIGLHGRPNTHYQNELNGQPEDFFIFTAGKETT